VLGACPKIASEYFANHLGETIRVFTSYDLEKQYAVYLCGNQYVHPPVMELAVPFASEGETAARFLQSKMEGNIEDLTTRDLLLVFAEMQRQKTYDVKGDMALMNLLRRKVGAIKDAFWREQANISLVRIVDSQ